MRVVRREEKMEMAGNSCNKKYDPPSLPPSLPAYMSLASSTVKTGLGSCSSTREATSPTARGRSTTLGFW